MRHNMEWIIENIGIISMILGGGSLTTFVGWIFGGRQQKRRDLKKSDVEIESAEVDYAEKVRQLYDKLEEKWTKERIELIEEKAEYKEVIKSLATRIDSLQEQFNTLNLAYVKEVEKSQYWMQKYDELDKKYNEVITQNKELTITNVHLEKLVEELRIAHEQLKREFDRHKKQQQK